MLAIVRRPHPALADCELTYLDRRPIDFSAALREHDRYVRALRAAGCETVVLPSLDELPDAVFVEDTAVVLDQRIALAAPGVASRQPEVAAIERTLAAHAQVVRPPSDVALEGGDVMQTEDAVFVGLSSRTGAPAIDYLQAHTDRPVIGVEVDGCLHLKTGVTYLGDRTFLIHRHWIAPESLRAAMPDARFLDVPEDRPFAANTLRLGTTLLASDVFPALEAHARAGGLDLVEVQIPELAKAECGLTCMSLILEHGSAAGRADVR